MNTSPVIIIEVVGVIVILAVAIFGLQVIRGFVRRLQSGQGPMGSVFQQSRELAKEAAAAGRERLEVEKEMLAVQKETNGLLRQIIAQLEKKP